MHICFVQISGINGGLSFAPQPHAKKAFAFTLVELLAVIAVVGLIMALLVPTMTAVQRKTGATTCLNNAKQLNLVWAMYAAENRETLASNPPLSPAGSWVRGLEDMSALNSDNTNSALMLSGSLGFLAKDARIYHCPSDTSFVPGLGYRVRSVAMNAFVGSRPFASDRHRNYQRMTDFNHPADTYVLLDEHPDSINDGWFLPVLGPADTRAWADLPGSYHDNGCTFSYADGHAEIHHWLDASTLKPISKRSRDGFPLPLNQAGKDLPWMMDRMSPSPDAGSTNSP